MLTDAEMAEILSEVARDESAPDYARVSAIRELRALRGRAPAEPEPEPDPFAELDAAREDWERPDPP
jgi:hypothetical protein